ncbi:Aste57867_12799 [Aphanomyces stellatus]|uniref:Aste57867_12799 protein n=1 Tax=Aphanomyces stellatus TaxID=120398 RepID=A0A485KX66_9STRA|nr:hypothetical protein As57867_012751 [Aphanomyces stellatus]VFT89648.1 Aste57867_12799 [Aphanomyces stellatus]
MAPAVHPVGAQRPQQANNDDAVQLKLLFRRPVRLLAVSKHLLSGIYYLIMSYLYATLSASNEKASQAFAPTAMVAVMGLFVGLHIFGLLRSCQGQAPRSRLWSRHSWPVYCLSTSTRLMIFHFLDVLCQSYQAFRVSEYLVDRTSAFSFAFFVSLNCLITPWFLVSKHIVVQESVVPLIQSLLGFVLSTLFQAYVVLVPVVYYTLSVSHQYDDKLNTRIVLLSRWILVTSTLDFVTKVIIQFSSYVALRQLVESINVPLRSTSSQTTPMAKYFQLEFNHNRNRLVYAVGMSFAGVALLGTSAAANWGRHRCPTTCVFELAPWWTSTCECAYVEINCVMQNTRGDTIDSFLQPSQLGSRVFCIDIRQCALSTGIPVALFAPYQNLFGLYISFSNMTQWLPDSNSTPFPDSLAAFRIYYSNLTAIPEVLAMIPPNLVYLRLEGAAITTIPDEYFKAWAGVTTLALNDMQLMEIPDALAANLATLEWLELRSNSITSTPVQWLAQHNQLTTVDVSGNSIRDGPWHLAKPGIVLALSSNPIATVPSYVDATLLAKRSILLDDTLYCKTNPSDACQSICARMCETKWIGNGKCDWSCFTSACQFDDGDCNSLGLL